MQGINVKDISQVTTISLLLGLNSSNKFVKIKPSDIVTVDSVLSATSTNPVQNKVVTAALNIKAPIESPRFTGTPKAPNPSMQTSNLQIATTAFVNSKVTRRGYIVNEGVSPGEFDVMDGAFIVTPTNVVVNFVETQFALIDDSLEKTLTVRVVNTSTFPITVQIAGSNYVFSIAAKELGEIHVIYTLYSDTYIYGCCVAHNLKSSYANTTTGLTAGKDLLDTAIDTDLDTGGINKDNGIKNAKDDNIAVEP